MKERAAGMRFDGRRAARVAALCLVCAALAALLTGCPEKVQNIEAGKPNFNAPTPPQSFFAEASATLIKLTWVTPDDDDDSSPFTDDDDDNGDGLHDVNINLKRFLIVRAENDYANSMPQRGLHYTVGSPLGSGGVVIADLDKSVDEFDDHDVVAGHTYYYEAFSYDDIPNYSESARLSSTPGSLVWARLSHTQTVLPDGRVLLTGGLGAAGPLNLAEIFDPAATAFSPVDATMGTTRFGHTATLMFDGRVLLVGGYEQGFADVLATAEIFDPTAGTFTPTTGQLTFARALHTATALPDGRVLLAGGTDGVNALDTYEVFDPATQQFAAVQDSLPHPRYGHAAALIADGVVVFGGYDGYQTVPSAAVVRLSSLRVTDLDNIPGRETPMVAGRLNATLTALASGESVIAGGFSGAQQTGVEIAGAELFTPNVAPYFIATGPLQQARSGHVAALLSEGKVLVCGGIAPGQIILNSAELYDPAAGAFAPAAAMNTPRTVAAMTRLADGRALVTGGNRAVTLFSPDPASTAEIYDPVADTFTVVGAQLP